ncbi:MAG: hypothetical protein AAGH82_04165 [Pseudomonadota bacterium]
MASEPTQDQEEGLTLELREQYVARVLASETFGKSERARALLAYLFEKQEAGEADQVKGFTIAMDVFGRDENFDPNNDALVRVHMGRLRDLLANYYRGEGEPDAVRMVVPKGRYVLNFTLHDVLPSSVDTNFGDIVEEAQPQTVVPAGDPTALTPDSEENTPTAPPRRWSRFAALGAVAATAILAVALVPNLWPTGADKAATETPQAQRGQAVPGALLRSMQGVSGAQFLPRLTFAHTKGLEYLESGADPFALKLRASLARFDTLQLVANGPLERIEAPRDVGRSYYALVVQEVAPKTGVPEPSAPSHRLELRHPRTGKILWTQFVVAPKSRPQDGPASDFANLDPTLIVLASRIAAIDGILVSHFVNDVGSNRLFDCLSLIAPVTQDLSPSSAEASVLCLGRLIAAGNRLPITHAFLALAIMEVARSGSSETASGLLEVDSVAESANEVIQQGLLTAPESAVLFGVQARTTLFQSGDYEAALDISRAAIERSNTSWNLWSSHARILAMSGDTEQADAIVDALRSETGRLAPGWAFTKFLTSLTRDDDEGIRSMAGQLTGVSNPFYYVARIVVAHRFNNFSERDEMIVRLQQTYPQFYANPPIFVRSMQLNAELREKLLLNMRQAGIYRQG